MYFHFYGRCRKGEAIFAWLEIGIVGGTEWIRSVGRFFQATSSDVWNAAGSGIKVRKLRLPGFCQHHN
jgi:hypothetical protein